MNGINCGGFVDFIYIEREEGGEEGEGSCCFLIPLIDPIPLFFV